MLLKMSEHLASLSMIKSEGSLILYIPIFLWI
jgi:hypothetical protein